MSAQKGKPKPSKAEVDFRIDRVCRMIVSGCLTSEIAAYGEKEWGVSRVTVLRYIRQARAQIKEDMQRDRTEYFAEHIATAHNLLKIAIQQKNVNGAVGVMNHIARLTHLEPK